MRTAVLLLAITPFAALALLDLACHRSLRKPSLAEDLLHLLLGASQVGLVLSAFRGNVPRILLSALVVVALGAIDEFAFHHGLPARESDLHAKGHFALLGFLVLALAAAVFPDVPSVQRALETGAP